MRSMLENATLVLGASLALAIVVKATAILLLALVAVRLARGSRAAGRHLFLAAAFAMLLALPIASVALPPVAIGELPIAPAQVAAPSAKPSFAHGPSAVRLAGDAIVADVVRPVVSPPAGLSGWVLLAGGWAAGAGLSLLPVFVGLWQLRGIRRSARRWQHGQSVLQQATSTTGADPRATVLLSEAVSGPVSWGVVRRIVLLPIDAPRWHANDLHRAIVHELEHLRRGDWLTQCLARVICAGYWFHPLAWTAWRRLTLEAERACDDAVLRDAEATAYADQLVMLAKRLSTSSNRSLLAMANRTDLATRVTAILDDRQQRGPAGTVWTALAGVASILLVMAMSPLQIINAAQAPTATQTFSGSVTDPLGRALADTRLTLWAEPARQPVEMRSDQAGHFAFTGLPPGGYRLQVQDFGWQGRFTLAAGQHLDRNVAVLMAGGEYDMNVSTTTAPTTLPPPPQPLRPPSQPSANDPDRAALARCATQSMFCRVTPPVRLASALPIYPPKQRESRVAGTVVVDALVGTDGLVKGVRPRTPADADFVAAASEALLRWQFTPMQFDGVPIEMTIQVTASFVAP